MDICTIALVTNLLGTTCSAPGICHATPDGLRQLCEPASCPPAPRQWECTKPDGTKYTYIETDSAPQYAR